MTQISDILAKIRAPKAFFVGLAVAGAASVSVVPAAGALPVNTGTTMPDYSQSTNVSADLAGSLGLGVVGSSLLQGGSTTGNTTSGVGTVLNTTGGVDVDNTTTAKDGETTTTTSVGAEANVGAAVEAMTSATASDATAGLSVGAKVDAKAKTDATTGSLLNGGLLDSSLLNL